MLRFLLLGIALFATPAGAADPHRPAAVFDSVPPALPDTLRGAVLVVSKTNGWRHIEHIPHSNAVLQQLAAALGRDSFVTENAAVFNDGQLQRFAAVVLNSASGDFLTADQRNAFARFVAKGGGVVALHAAGDDSHIAPWYIDTIIGTRFIGHPGGPDQFQNARVAVAAVDHPVMAGVRQPWTLRDEWYSFTASPARRGMTVLAVLDERSYRPGRALAMGQVHPIIWANTQAGGRIVYAAMGHLPEAYDDPNFRLILSNAIRWVAPQAP